jgi:hypothetical protein
MLVFPQDRLYEGIFTSLIRIDKVKESTQIMRGVSFPRKHAVFEAQIQQQ